MTSAPTLRDRLARFRTGAALVLLGGSLALHAMVVLSFVFRWDKAALVTVVPFFVWCGMGLSLAVVSAFFQPTLLFRVLGVVWLGTLVLGADERHGLLRFRSQVPQPHPPVAGASGQPLRFATLNCHYFGQEGMDTVTSWGPDILFLQETTPGSGVVDLARRLYGNQALIVRRHDCTILARGSVIRAIDLSSPAVPPGDLSRNAMGRLTLANGREIDLVNLHLLAAETNTAFWRRSCWQAHAHNRRMRRILLHYFVSGCQSATAGWPPAPSIIAGDFNAPAEDGAIRGLAATHLDSYVTAGQGIGDTFPANFPLHRIDQVWLSPGLAAIGHTTVPVPGSDHLMVVVDFEMK